MDYSEDRRILKQAIDDNKLVVFVGAGASINSGIPLWSDAVNMINNKINSTAIENIEMLKIPQIYFNSRGEKEYNELIKEIFKYDDKFPNMIHETIVKLKPTHIITTNYDDFLERAFISNGEFLDIVQKDSDIPYCKNSRMIIKMHGGFIYNNFVLKEDDYLNYSYNFALIETYIKALVAKNVILFIGYSYNDPDTKQIFNWVKNILRDNFQRAYYLDARNDYDLNIVNYYKNLGINIIYSSELSKDVINKDNIFENTLYLLDYIIKDDKEADITNIVYQSSQHLISLNYILADYIPSLFKNLYVYYDEGNLRLLNNETEELFKALNNEAIINKSNKLLTIKKVLEKTIIKHAYIYNNKLHKPEILCSFNNTSPELSNYEDFDNQNFLSIKKYTDINILLEDNQQQLHIAYCYYELHEYQKCYALLKKVSLSYKQQQNYIWYFITEFNRLHVGKLISKSIYWNTNNEYKNEIEQIDLSDILYNNALKGKNENNILKELENFTLMYKTLSKVLNETQKIEKDADTNYVMGSNSTNLNSLETSVIDFYKYLLLNHLMIDAYTEVKEVYKQYIKAIFYSNSKEEKEYKNGIFGSGKNIVLKEISAFSIIIICKYLDLKSLNDILSKNEIKKITLSKEAESKLFEIFNNYLIAYDNKIRLDNLNDKILVILHILEISKLSQEQMVLILTKINHLLNKNLFERSDYLKINDFIIRKYSVDNSLLNTDILILLLQTICNGVKNNIWESTVIKYIHTIFMNLSYIIHEINKDIKLNNSFSEAIIESDNINLLPDLYIISSNIIQESIKSAIILTLEKDEFNYELYCKSILYKIIDKRKDFEEKLFEKVKQINDNSTSNIRNFSNPLEDILNSCMELYLNGNLIDSNELEPYIKSFPYIEFLYNMNDFDYSKFQLSWFQDANELLKKDIIQNQKAFNETKKLYRNALESNDYEQEMLNDYLKYFDR